MSVSSLITPDDDVVPFFKLSLKDKLPYMKELFVNSFPTVAAFLTPALTTFISLYFLSKYHNDELIAGYGLGAMFSSAFGLAWIYSFNQATNVFISQAFGAQNYDKCGTYLRRNIIILGFLLIPLGICLITADKIMILFGVKEELAIIGGTFTRLSLPFMVGATLFDSMKSFLIGQKVFNPILYIQGFTLCLHAIWSKIFLDIFHLGIEGTVVCRILEEWANAGLIYFYIKKSGKFTKTWGSWNKGLIEFQELWKQFKFSTSISFISYVQWIFYEVLTIIAGNFDAKQVVVHVAIGNTSSVPFLYTMAVGVTMLTYVGNNLGAKKTIKARNYSHAGYTLLILLTVFFGSALWIILNQWLVFWSSDLETQDYLLQAVKIYSFGSLLVDGINNGMVSILKSVGKERQTIISILASLYMIGIPLIILCAFVLGLKVAGIWLAFGIASVALSLIHARNIFRLNWTTIQRDVTENLKNSQSRNDQELNQLL